MRLEINSEGVRQLLKDVGQNACGQMAVNIATSCGEGYAADTYDAGSRVVASVYTDSGAAARDNLENNTILRNLGNGNV